MVRRIWTSSPGWRLYGRPGAGIVSVPSSAVLVADRLVAGVELVEVVVRGLGEHDRRAPVRGVGVGGVERGVFGAGAVGADVDARAGGVAADRELVVAVAEAGLVAAVGGVVGAEVAGQHGLRGVWRGWRVSRWGQSPPAPTGGFWCGSPTAINLAPDASTAARRACCSRVEASAASSWMIVVCGPRTTVPLVIAVWSAASE